MTAPLAVPRNADSTPEQPNAGNGEGLDRVGPMDLGTVTIADRVLEKIAAQAAAEVRDAGAPASQLIGRAISKVGLGNRPGTELGRHPQVDADIDGSLAFLELKLSVRWPCSVPQVTEDVRKRVASRVSELLGLTVQKIDVTVVDLVTAVSTTRVA